MHYRRFPHPENKRVWTYFISIKCFVGICEYGRHAKRKEIASLWVCSMLWCISLLILLGQLKKAGVKISMKRRRRALLAGGEFSSSESDSSLSEYSTSSSSSEDELAEEDEEDELRRRERKRKRADKKRLQQGKQEQNDDLFATRALAGSRSQNLSRNFPLSYQTLPHSILLPPSQTNGKNIRSILRPTHKIFEDAASSTLPRYPTNSNDPSSVAFLLNRNQNYNRYSHHNLQNQKLQPLNDTTQRTSPTSINHVDEDKGVDTNKLNMNASAPPNYQDSQYYIPMDHTQIPLLMLANNMLNLPQLYNFNNPIYQNVSPMGYPAMPYLPPQKVDSSRIDTNYNNTATTTGNKFNDKTNRQNEKESSLALSPVSPTASPTRPPSPSTSPHTPTSTSPISTPVSPPVVPQSHSNKVTPSLPGTASFIAHPQADISQYGTGQSLSQIHALLGQTGINHIPGIITPAATPMLLGSHYLLPTQVC